MSSGINRLHGRTFLQKDLCYEVFHRGYENSVFNTTYNFNGGNICGGGFWGGFAGGMGMGLGAGLMGMLGNWMGGFGNMFGGFPMFGNFGCFGGGFPMMNWWGGGAGGSNASTTTVTGGSTTHNHYSTTKLEKDYDHDREPIQDFGKRLKKFEKAKKINVKKFRELYNEINNYHTQDSVEEEKNQENLSGLKDRLNKLIQKHGITISDEEQKAQVETPKQTPVQQAEEVVEAGTQNNGPQQVAQKKSLADRIAELDDNDIDGILRLYAEAGVNPGEELGDLEDKFDAYLMSIKTDKAKLEALKEKVKYYPDLLDKVNRALTALEEPEEEEDDDDEVIPADLKADFEGYNLTDNEISKLLECCEWGTKDGKKCLVPTTKISNEALVILNNHREIKVAFANNPKAEDDTWIIGSVEIKKDDIENGEVKSYTINCKDVGKYGLEFKVTNIKNNLYNIQCTSTENVSSYEKVYAADGGRTYKLGEDGVLHHSDSRGTVISKHKKNGYKEIPAKKLR